MPKSDRQTVFRTAPPANHQLGRLRSAIAGFSDGASYALSVGITNGDLFSHIIAFSPGFMVPADQVGSPQLFISQGKIDDVLPIEQCSRIIVPELQQAGYQVLYQEFDGPHTVPIAIARKALEWFTAAQVATGNLPYPSLE